MKVKMILKLLAVSLIVAVFVGCSSNDDNNKNASETESPQQQGVNQSNLLKFNEDNYTSETFTIEGVDLTFRAYENIVYVENPVDPTYESINIYIPEAYFNGESIGNFTAESAPIFLPNNIGGYMPAEPGKPSMEGAISGEASRAGMTSTENSEEESPNSLLLALSKGYVVASPGARGRTNESEDGQYFGKAPAAIVDLKAAVRYLHFNDEVMPGDADKIISNGTSAGGALSILLGSTGNSIDYEKYLSELGAADASDKIYAVSAYCPITNLENADIAYEWMFNGVNNYVKTTVIKDNEGNIVREKENLIQTAEQMLYSDELKSVFPSYLNSLNLKGKNDIILTLDENGEGTFKEYVKSYIIKSVQNALDQGEDCSKYTWVQINGDRVIDIDFNGYVAYLSRAKAAPAFDAVDLSTAENSLFGTSGIEAQHFTEFSLEHDTVGGNIADNEIIKVMNPMSYINKEERELSNYWRIRHGVEDSDTSLAIPVILSLELENQGATVDFAVPWGQGHGGDYDLEKLFAWIEGIVR